MDFALLPPEINSARMYNGAGSSPMLAAAAAWDGLATELHDMATACESTVAELTASWRGPSSAAMATSAAPYTAWLRTTAGQAEQAAGQSRSAAAAYEAAFAATVPPTLIAANRSLLAALVATNVLGQNAPAIATAEAHYAQMWAQDAAAMYGYAGSAAAATALSPFTEPPQTTDAAGSARQAVTAPLRRLISTVPNAVRNLNAVAARPAAAATSPVESVLQGVTEVMSTLTGPYSPLGHLGLTGGWWLVFGQILGLAQNPPGVANLLSAPTSATGAFAPLAGFPSTSAGPVGGTVTSTLGRAGLIGNLSVPPAWAANAPAVKTVAATLSSTASAAAGEEDQAGLFAGAAAVSGLTGRVMNAAAARSVTGAAPRTIGTAAAYTLAPAAVPDAAGDVTIIVVPASDPPH